MFLLGSSSDTDPMKPRSLPFRSVRHVVVVASLIAPLSALVLEPHAAQAATGRVLTVGVGGAFPTAKAALAQVAVGDTIVFKAGQHFERQIDINKSGTPGNPITITAEPGAILNHGLKIDTIRYVGEGAFDIIASFADPFDQAAGDQAKQRTTMIVVADKPYVRVYSRNLLQPGQFLVQADGTIFMRPRSDGPDPTPENTTVINASDAPYYEYSGIRMNAGVHDIVLDDLDQRGAGAAVQLGYYNGPAAGGNIEVKNCTIKNSWQYGIRMDQQRNVLVSNCEVAGSGLTNYPRARYARDFNGNLQYGSDGKPKRPDWPVAIIGWNADNVTVQGSYIHDNHGEGVGPFVDSSDWTIRNNVVADNWSVNIYSSTQIGGTTIDSNVVYNSSNWINEIEDPANLPNPKQADGIRVANEGADFNNDPDAIIEGIRIVNNLVVGTAGGINSFRYAPLRRGVLKDSIIANNTVATWTSGSFGRNALVVNNGDNVTVDNNIVEGGKLFLEGVGAGITATNNLLGVGIETATGAQVNGTILAQPKFIGNYAGGADGYRVVPGSPGDNAARPVAGLTLDGLSRPRSATPDIGAYEN